MLPSSSNSLTFTKILSGLSKSLNIVQEIMPIYQNTKPLISKVKGIVSNIKIPSNQNLEKKQINKKITTSTSNNPSFFL